MTLIDLHWLCLIIFYLLIDVFLGFLFHTFRAIGQCETPANLWIIENAKHLVNARFLQSQKKQNDKSANERKHVLHIHC